MPFFSEPSLHQASSTSSISSSAPNLNALVNSTLFTSFHDYYDLDVILMEQEGLPATFRMTVPGMGYLAGSHNQTDIREGTPLFLSLWLIESLAIDALVYPSLPKAFVNSSLKNLRASPTSVNLWSLSPYFYLLGEKLMHMSGDERKVQTLSRSLTNALKERFGWILDYTQTPLEEHTSSFIQGLDMTEKEILKKGQDAAEMYRRWTTSPLQLKRSSSLIMVERELGRGF